MLVDAVDAVLLLGPTACGKSALALQLARTIELEIVSIDSAQVYRGMDIGTAKPTAAERAQVPHHLLDLRDPAEPYSAAEFVRDAQRAIFDIRARGRLPLVVGGTMLYARALRQGLSALPSADHTVRARIEARARAHGWPALHAELASVDPATAARLSPNDSQRIQRALEVFELTGTPLSRLQQQPQQPPLKLLTIALLPADRAQLHRRIEQRFDAMLAAGFLEEVRALMQRGDLTPALPSMRAVGYRQAWEHLARGTPVEEFRAAAIAATRGLAKRQITWLRSMRDAAVLDPFAPDTPQRLRQLLRSVTATSASSPAKTV
ncbi:MAG: tRNA (adenosine(37)-N6)-dimethylallyltransferase MiaA [Sutterellaceae bacterium]|nr:tRNA (adenosine(37)-N6)-dimethylallyltransferase MiaA [Burkholderiaceae bacterium]MCX7901449.1 tRNA (adenosine(37)-N6)-dimethylallyltransferase MiaA [Burkholderiaceae bacterium]MDW8430855.1 tRNA (adenosine(37)-N6)-dimethylallyltransferase MiaA [Sutterellaceae bacterium]